VVRLRVVPGKWRHAQPHAGILQGFSQHFGTFTLQTAARMNAAFPVISPAVDLPTRPPRRVVDAGYFDNYGMATRWPT